MLENRNPRYDLFAVILLVGIVFLAASLFTYDKADPVGSLFPPLDQFYQSDILVYPQNESPRNACGYWGALTADVLFTTLGIGAYFLVTGLIAITIAILQNQSMEMLWSKTVGWFLTLVGMTTLASLCLPSLSLGPIIGPGGYLGALAAGLLELHFARIGGMILAISVFGIGLFMWTEYALLNLIASTTRSMRRASQKVALRKRKATSDAPASDSEEDEEVWVSEWDEDTPSILDEYEEELDEDAVAEDDEEDDELEDEEEDSELAADEEWDEDVEEEDPPRTLPFVVKTAAKTAALLRGKKKPSADEESSGDVENSEEPTEAPRKQRKGFGFGRKKETAASEPPAEPTAEPTPPTPPSERELVMKRLNHAADCDDTTDYDLPEVHLLKASPKVSVDAMRTQTMKRGRLLEQKFKEFGINIKVVDVETGPVITQYELQLEAGLRLAKISNLADDIAIGLRVPSVRIVAPIPGKNTVGIEVPNETRQMVRLRDVIEQSAKKTKDMKIPLFLGQDVAGDTMVADLSKLPHLLIAGRTGTGKSVCLNAIITSILMTRRPDEVRMLMIDPKMVELSGYGRLPHLMHPVVTDMRKAEAILAWAVEKMEDRYRLLARAGVRHINSYNQLGEEELMDRLRPQSDEERAEIPTHLPFIVIVADEMADLMMTAGKEVEQHIIRLAQKSRAVGIHLILATQKPTVDVITGLIKSNLPARISFQVASQNDSRVVLDSNGAEKLLGNGDMLFLWPGTSTLLRGQGTFLGDDEIDSITDSVSTGEQNFVNELVNLKVNDDDDGENGPAAIDSRDELYQKAVETVIRENRGSVSLLQRALSIGYGRAARLIDYMEEDGIVGPYKGSKSREILMTMDQWHSACSQKASGSKGSSEDSSTPDENGRVTRTLNATASAPRTPASHPSHQAKATPRNAESDASETVFQLKKETTDPPGAVPGFGVFQAEDVDEVAGTEALDDAIDPDDFEDANRVSSETRFSVVNDEVETLPGDEDEDEERFCAEDEGEDDQYDDEDAKYDEEVDEDDAYSEDGATDELADWEHEYDYAEDDDSEDNDAEDEEDDEVDYENEYDGEEEDEVEASGEFEDEEYGEDEDGGEDADDEEWEYEYVDEDGNPVDESEDADDEEWEYEYVDEDEDV